MSQVGEDESWKVEALRLQQENPNLTKREIADKLGKPLQTVKRVLQQNSSKQKVEADSSGKVEHQCPLSSTMGSKSNEESVSHEICEIAGKGHGMIASQDLKKGHVVVAVALLLCGRGEADAINNFETLSHDDRAKVMDLYDCHSGQDQTKRTLEGILRSNTFGNASVLTLCPIISRVNHSCVPNCSYYGQGVLRYNTGDSPPPVIPLVANHDIAKGTELTIDYIGCCLSPMDFSTRGRRAATLKGKRFLCQCEACSMAPEEQGERDAALAEVVKLLEFHMVATVPAMQDCMQPVFDDIETAQRALEYVDEALTELLPRAYAYIPPHVEKMHHQFGFTAALFLYRKTSDRAMLLRAGDHAVRVYAGVCLLNGGRDINDASEWKSIVRQLKYLGYVGSSVTG